MERRYRFLSRLGLRLIVLHLAGLASTGFIHIEAPKDQNFKLGNFIHIWGKQFSQLNYQVELDQTDGWQAFVDGKPYSGDFHNMVLKSHMVITLAYRSTDIHPDTTYPWPS